MDNLSKLEQLISEIRLKSPVFNKKDADKATFIVFGEIDNQKVVLKTFLSSNAKRVTGFGKEKAISELKDIPDLSLSLSPLLAPQIINEGRMGEMIWYIKMFEPGEVLGMDQKDASEALWNCDKIAEPFVDRSREYTPGIVEGLKRLQSVDLETVKSKLGNLSQERFLSEDLEAKSVEFEQTLNLDLKTQRKIFAESKELLCRNITLCLNDLVPPNILIHDHEVKFFDLENICLDHKLTDLVELWLFLWRYPDWQSELLAKFPLSAEDKFEFRLLVIRRIILSGMSRRFKRYQEVSGQSHLWLDYLEKATESFEALIKVK